MTMIGHGTSTRADEGWQARAACRDADPELFFPPDSEGGDVKRGPRKKAMVNDAKRWCHSCAVRRDYLQFAYQTDDRFAILGGLTPLERANRRKKRACPMCSAIFAITDPKSQRKYCSPECIGEAKRQRQMTYATRKKATT